MACQTNEKHQYSDAASSLACEYWKEKYQV